jgi:hypothetical protein
MIRILKTLIAEPYRPELHYMRGPGPKWHAKHDPTPGKVNDHTVLALLRANASAVGLTAVHYKGGPGQNRRSPMSSYLVRGVAFMAVLFGAVTSSAAGGASFTRCAARDMQILMMLEQSDSGNVIVVPDGHGSLSALFDARVVCLEGRVLDALAIYDNIASRYTMDRVFSGRMNDSPVPNPDFRATVP